MANESRKWTMILLNAMDDSMLDPKEIVRMCMNYMPEYDVEQMCYDYDLDSLDPTPQKEEDEDAT